MHAHRTSTNLRNGLTPLMAVLLGATLLAGCSKEPQPAPKAPAASAAPAAAQPAPAAAPAQAKSDSLPAECESYIKTVTACVEKAGNNPAAATFKQQMESSRAEWAKIPDKAAFASTCKQMEDTFKASAAPALKC